MSSAPQPPPGSSAGETPWTLLRDQFRAAWLAGAPPRIEDWLSRCPEADRGRLLRELIAVDRQHRPDADFAEYRARFPDLEQEIKAEIHSGTGPGVDSDPSQNATTGTGTDDNDDYSLGTATGLPSIPGYELLGELGRGGMGVVYRARQVALKRVVALKMIPAGPQASPAALVRFRTEEETVARLQHPNIVQIHEIGEQGGLPFCALELVDGGSLADRLKSGCLSADFRETARLVEVLARAIHHAHEHGVIHRDLKPANILLTADGVPKITDFGLAKQLDVDSGQTQTGQVMGTPSYMAPEQADGRVRDFGPATDVWALGAVLYELLTGRPPFRGASPLETLEQVRAADPVPPRRHRSDVPRDLETICLKCLQKEPAHRYGSALALAQDLESFRAGEPIRAQPDRLVRLLGRKLRRHRVGVGATLGVVLALSVAAVVGFSYRQARQITALQAGLETGLDLDPTQWTAVHLATLEAAVAELGQLDPVQAAGYRERLNSRFRQALNQSIGQPRLETAVIARIEENLEALAARDPAAAPDFRRRFQHRLSDWETVIDLAAPFDGWERVLPGGVRPVDGSLRFPIKPPVNLGPAPLVLTGEACVGNAQLEVRFDDAWQQVPELSLVLNAYRGPTGPAQALAWSVDGQVLATSTRNGSVALWDAVRGRQIHTMEVSSEVRDLVMAPTGGLVLVATIGGVLQLDLAAGSRTALPGSKGSTTSLALSPDRRWLAVGRTDGTVQVYETTGWQVHVTLQGHTKAVTQVAFSPDGKTLAAGGADQTVRFWDVPTFTPRPWVASQPGPVLSLAFAPDGTLAVSSPFRVLLWDVAVQKVSRTLEINDSSPLPCRLVFVPDGSGLAIGFLIWDLQRNSGSDWLIGRTRESGMLAFAPDGSRLAYAVSSGPIYLVDPRNRTILHTMAGQGYRFALSAVLPGHSRPTGDGPATLGHAARQAKAVYLHIERNGLRQREQPVVVPPGPLTLRASRVGDQLQVQVNNLPALTFRDAFPLPARSGSYGLIWPLPVGVTHVLARRQALPAAPSALERGEELLANRDYLAALESFQQAARAAGPADGQEARFKAARCLVELNRPDEAADMWERLAGEPGERWPLLAACHLWTLRLRQNRWADAEILFANLSTRFRYEELAGVVAEVDRRPLINDYTISGADWFLFTAGMETRYEQVVQIMEFLRATLAERLAARKNLMRAYQLAGRSSDSRRAAEEGLRQWDGEPSVGALELVIEYANLLRVGGDSEGARAVLARYRPLAIGWSVFQLEEARLALALDELEAAECLLDECVAKAAPDGRVLETYTYSGAQLLRGFLREQRGDPDAARAIWREAYLAGRDGPGTGLRVDDGRTLGSFFPLFFHWMLGSLSGAMTDADAERLFNRFKSGVRTEGIAGRLAELLTFSPTVIRQVWQTPRGREIARAIACRSTPFDRIIRGSVDLMIAEYIHHGSFGSSWTSDQEKIVWQAVTGFTGLYYVGKLSRVQVLPVALTWKGTTNILGWGGLAPLLAPEQRGPLAFVFGHRYLRLKQPMEAERFFRTALDDSSPDSTLRQLAQAELDRLAGK